MYEIEPETCPYCNKWNGVHFLNAWVEDDIFTEEYHCDNCAKSYRVEYDIANPRYRTS